MEGLNNILVMEEKFNSIAYKAYDVLPTRKDSMIYSIWRTANNKGQHDIQLMTYCQLERTAWYTAYDVLPTRKNSMIYSIWRTANKKGQYDILHMTEEKWDENTTEDDQFYSCSEREK